VFRNNRNKQKTNRNSSKFVKISTFLIPQTKSSVCFDTGPKHRNKPQKKFGFAKRQTEKQPKQIKFQFVSVRTEKKNERFWGPPNRERFLEIFLVCFEKILFVSVISIPVQNTETNRNKLKKMFFGFAKQTEKQPKQFEFQFVSVRTEKKFDCFEDTLGLTAYSNNV
jgi:hypothetical protein